jgi:hypothetical protein
MPVPSSRKAQYQAYEGRCLETLDAALSRTPMYNEWRSLDPGEDSPLDVRFAALPALTKTDIRKHFPYGVVPRGLDLDAALASGQVSFVQTSGTADESLTNLWNQEWWDASERASWSLNAHTAGALTGSHREAILASALSVGPRSEGPPIRRDERMLNRFLFLNEYGSTAQWPEGHEDRIRKELEEYAPVVLEANPSLLAPVGEVTYGISSGAALVVHSDATVLARGGSVHRFANSKGVVTQIEPLQAQ